MQRGFSTIELILVVTVLSIVATVGLFQAAGSIMDTRLHGARNEIIAALEYAQMTAASRGSACRVTIDAGDGGVPTVRVEELDCGTDLLDESMAEVPEGDVENQSYHVVEYPMNRGSSYDIDFGDYGRFRGVVLVSTAFATGAPVVFDALGAPSKGGTVVLAYGTRQLTVVLDPVTGRAS